MGQKTPKERRNEELDKSLDKSLTPVSADGDEMGYEVITFARCQHCGPSKPKALLALIMTSGNTETLRCMNCVREVIKPTGWHKQYIDPPTPPPEAA